VDLDRAIARLNTAREQQPLVDGLQQVRFGGKDASPFRRQARVVQEWKDPLARAAMTIALLLDGLTHLLCDASILATEIARRPGGQVKGALKFLAEVLLKVGRGHQGGIGLGRRKRDLAIGGGTWLAQRLGHGPSSPSSSRAGRELRQESAQQVRGGKF